MKKILLKTSLGLFALKARDKLILVHSALINPEACGTLANDILATKLVTKICQPEKIFIDIGSHIGSIISGVQRSNRSIKIIGIEAIPEKIEYLRKNFHSVEFYECALGDDNAKVTFYIYKHESGYSSLLKPKVKPGQVVKEISVSLKKLDELARFENVDVIKIDVEGTECSVIKGGKETVIRNKPIIMFESAPGKNDAKEELWNVFNSLNFGIHLPNRLAHNDNALSLDGFKDSHIYPRHTTNYFAVSKDRRDEYRNRARKILGINT